MSGREWVIDLSAEAVADPGKTTPYYGWEEGGVTDVTRMRST